MFIYEVEGLVPPRNSDFGRWGFAINFDRVFALRLRNKKLNGLAEILRVGGIEIIKGFGFSEEVNNPYLFLEKSALIQGVVVPGNSTDLSLDESSKRTFFDDYFSYTKMIAQLKTVNPVKELCPVRYVPHNVDSKEQAYCLLSLFFNWANIVRVLNSN